jgi:hypothetical protein
MEQNILSDASLRNMINGGIIVFSSNFWMIFAIVVAIFYSTQQRQYRRGWRRAGMLLRTATQLRDEGHTDLATEVLCSLAVLHPRFAVMGATESLLQEQLDNPTHRNSLLLAYEAMHKVFPENPGLSYKLAYLYHLSDRPSEAVYLLDVSLNATPEANNWKARMTELRDKLQTIPEDAKPADSGDTDSNESTSDGESAPE